MNDVNNSRKDQDGVSVVGDSGVREPDELIPAMESEVQENLEQSDANTEKTVEETETGDKAEEAEAETETESEAAEAKDKTEEAEAEEETESEAAEAEDKAEETEDTAGVEAEADSPEAEDTEEAFDRADTDILDVSMGIASGLDAPTEELPVIPAAAAATAEELSPAELKAQQKAEKKRLKEEAASQKRREKQEAKERKKQEKAEKKAAKQEQQEEQGEKKKKGPWKMILLILLLLVAAAAVVYMALANRYKTIFFDGTKINGADCTGLTVEEAETVIARQMDAYDLTVKFRDGKTELINGETIGFAYVSDGSVQELKDMQVPVLWLSAFFEEYSYEATSACAFDEVMLSNTVAALSECDPANMTAPQDASLVYNEETKNFEIVPEQAGNTFDPAQLLEAVKTAVSKGERELSVEELGIYENPGCTSEDPELNSRMEDLNSVISSSITYQLPNGETRVLDADILVNWIGQDETGNYFFDSEHWGSNVANFVEDLAKEVNTSDSKTRFNTINGGVVVLDNYLRGWVIDEEAEGAQLAEELASRTVTTREPVYAQRAYSEENNGVGNTYVEIDLSAQYLWAVENGQVVIESPIVSGTMVPSRYTPEGIYPLYGKQEGRWLRGTQYADGSYEYESWVDYWMPFNGGIGMHDASWRVSFGGSTYIGGGSHGCINMPFGKAAAVFDWIQSGTPIICYYSGGYSLAADGTYGE
ncbi:MAG: L,D-transpeptidase family protein [Lachnospiraceae bacterium]|nr:L,D-transpeptidase family protein [Lachnospiraceae bacterium]